ncbi:MAG: hypothetical protein UU76_C0003G0018 [Parcubacteria group bacterium GW2011_GWC1_41_7]|nr:MAG: hypothetical protein UU76_C0003G0018 [Parcubacteria group bacterium GW2011_GWC1_41_7]
MQKIHQAPHNSSSQNQRPKRIKDEFHPERSLLQQQGQTDSEHVNSPSGTPTSGRTPEQQRGQKIYDSQENRGDDIKPFSSLQKNAGSDEQQGKTPVVALFFTLWAGLSLDIVEIISAGFDLTIIAGILIRLVTLPIEALYVLLFTFVCWSQKIPSEERNVANLIRGTAMLFQGVELSANFFPPGLALIEILPLKTLSVIMIFFLRPLIKKLAPNIPGGEEALATIKNVSSKIPDPKKVGK